jgi:DEAD/DEAH box helicase domain-containing protein
MAESQPHSEILQKLVAEGLLSINNRRFVADHKRAMEFLGKHSIRGIGTKVDIKIGGKICGERALPVALDELHTNAIYFLAGRRYRVKELHFENGKQPYAELMPVSADYPYYTRAITDEWPSILDVHRKRNAFGIEAQYCTFRIRKQVLGYANIEIGQEAARGRKVMLDKPLEFEFITKGFVFKSPRPDNILAKVDDEHYVETSAFHAAEHVVIEGSAMITGGASQDLGGISLGSSGLIFIYDGSIGGNGASMVLFERLDKAFERSVRILSECPCTGESGCPRCTFSYRCGNNNEFLHKKAALEVLERITDGEMTSVGDKVEGDRALV